MHFVCKKINSFNCDLKKNIFLVKLECNIFFGSFKLLLYVQFNRNRKSTSNYSVSCWKEL